MNCAPINEHMLFLMIYKKRRMNLLIYLLLSFGVANHEGLCGFLHISQRGGELS